MIKFNSVTQEDKIYYLTDSLEKKDSTSRTVSKKCVKSLLVKTNDTLEIYSTDSSIGMIQLKILSANGKTFYDVENNDFNIKKVVIDINDFVCISKDSLDEPATETWIFS